MWSNIFVAAIPLILQTTVSGMPKRQFGTISQDIIFDYNNHWNPIYNPDPNETPVLKPESKSATMANKESKSKLIMVDISKMNYETAKFRLLKQNQIADLKQGRAISSVTCATCLSLVIIMKHYIGQGKSEADFVQFMTSLCDGLSGNKPRGCDGFFQLYVSEIYFVLSKAPADTEQICSMVVGDECGEVENPAWSVKLPKTKKPFVSPPKVPKVGQLVMQPNVSPLVTGGRVRLLWNNFQQYGVNGSGNTRCGRKSDAPVFKVLQVSDTHIDPHYMEGASTECTEPICCRQSTGLAKSKKTAAGRWGHYFKCDIPERTVINMLQHIKKTHPDIDYILFTGDTPPHDIWNQTRHDNLKSVLDAGNMLAEAFPGVPIFSSLGNHEGVPLDSFTPPFIKGKWSMSWMYDKLDEQWRQWLPTSTSSTIRHGAFYSVLLRPGFRLISINSNYCNNMNWWLQLNTEDPADELKWLIHQLQIAESKNEKVHIVGHIPPGYKDCLIIWSRNFYNIVNRFESTIVAQFYGHTHNDEFELFYDKDQRRATSMAYICPGVAVFNYMNPAYRIYYIDGDHEETTRRVVDHETWVMNLLYANMMDSPIWYKLYSAREAYNMSSLLPSDWEELSERLANDDQLFDLFYKHYWKDSPVRPPCDDKCRRKMLCDLHSGSRDRKIHCKHLRTDIPASKHPQWP